MAPTVHCAECGTRSDGAYCQQCGAPLGGRQGHPRDRRAWVVAGILASAAVVGVATLVARGAPGPSVPAMANAGGRPAAVAPLPDLSSLGPHERFARLFDRLMRAGAEWDSATVASLSPLAVEAYAELDSVDADTRFHAGLIAIQIGNFPGAHALADTLEARDPGHLFGPILVGALARLEGDTAAYRRALVQFRERAPQELARNDRPEYIEHQQLLAEVQRAAETK
jgi:hypothetical protein